MNDNDLNVPCCLGVRDLRLFVAWRYAASPRRRKLRTAQLTDQNNPANPLRNLQFQTQPGLSMEPRGSQRGYRIRFNARVLHDPILRIKERKRCPVYIRT